MSFRRLFSGMIAAFVVVSSFAPMSAVRAESETTSSVDFSGQLIELSSTDVPTTIVVRENPTGEFTDYTVDIDADTAFGTNAANTTAMTDWITGDSLRVVGTLNENTGVVTAETVVNASLNPKNHRGLNGWITGIDDEDDTMTVQWDGEERVVNITSDTHMVVSPTNPAALSDFQIGDRVRLRLTAGTEDARIIVALRRGDNIYLKARTRGFTAELTDIDEDGDSGILTVTLLANSHLRADDVNNLVGTEGDELTVTYDANTKFVRKFNGVTTVDELAVGDTLFVVGRVNDDETISARLVKDTNIWRLGVVRHAGEIVSVDTDDNDITVRPARSEDDDVETIVVSYDENTEFKKGGEAVGEDGLEAGDIVHVRGTARLSDGTMTIYDVETVTVVSALSVDDEDEPEDSE